jgi:hypothetical protein
MGLRPTACVAGQQPDASGVAPDHHAKAVVLDLVNPAGTARRVLGGGWKAGFDEAGSQQSKIRIAELADGNSCKNSCKRNKG